MALEPVLIAGEWRQPANPTGSFKAIDPSTGKPLPNRIPCRRSTTSSRRSAPPTTRCRAAIDLRPMRIGRFLDDYASRIEAAADALVERAALETGLPREPRLRNVELPRTTNQLRQGGGGRARAFVDAWRRSTPRRTCARTTGRWAAPVVVFGPNNFPFAFNSVAGGDFAAAIAAGNPVIAKANTGHPGTSKLLAELALEAARDAGLPPGMVQLLYRTPPDVGFVLVSRSARRRDRLHRQQARGPQAEGGGRSRRQADLPRDVEHQPGVRAARRARRARRGDRQGALRFVRDGGGPVLHAAPAWRSCPKATRRAAFVAELTAMFKAGPRGHAARAVGRERDRGRR